MVRKRSPGYGGVRQGTPGKGYSNRTDLITNRAPQAGLATAASGGVPVPPAPAAGPPPEAAITPDQVPGLDAPSNRPNEPVTHGSPSGPGGGLESLGWTPPDPNMMALQAAYLRNPTPELRRSLNILYGRGM